MTRSDQQHALLIHRVFQYLAIISVFAVIGGGYWYWKNARAAQTVTDNRPSFEAPLTHDLNLARGQGSATYSRSDGADRRATVSDFEGLIRPVKSGEARFEGARRVENRLVYSEAFDNAAWTKTGTSTLTANTGIAPDGTQTADQLVTTTTSNYQVRQSTTIPKVGEIVTFSIWARQTAGTAASITIDVNDGIQTNVTLASYWQRFSVSGTPGSSSTNIFTDLTFTQTGTYELWGAQLEMTTGQANQNPSEYVSVGVKTSAPYHGAGVDGVKYFDTENGNTVASNVVTEATGTAIATATLKGYLAEGTRTNLLTYSEQLENSNFLPRSSVTANAIVAPDGKMTADKLVEDATAANTHYARRTGVVSSGTTYSYSVYAKAGERSWLALGSNWVSTFGAYFDLSNGTVGTVIGSASANIISVGNGWYRCTISGTWNDVYVDTMLATGNGTISYTGDATSGLYLWGGQIEQASFASSYIPTTTASMTRGTDNLKYIGASNFNGTAGSITVDVTTEWNTNSGVGAYFIDDTSTLQLMALWSWNGTSNHLAADRKGGGGTRNSIDYTGLPITSGTLMRLGHRWNSTATSLFRDGSLRGSDTTLTLPYDSISGISVGIRADVNSLAYSNLKNVRAWKKALSDTELSNLTSLTRSTSDSAVKKTTVKTPDNTGLAAYWSFEDGSGTRAEDFSPNGANTATLSNSPAWVDGKFGKAIDLNGTSQYATAADAATLRPSQTGSMTISAWVYNQDAGGEWRGLLVKGSSEYGIWRSSASPGKWHFRTGSPSEVINSTADAAVNTWSHLTMTFSVGGTLTAYVDGAAIGTKALPAGVPASSSSALSIGRNGSEYFDGLIDDVRIYNRELMATEVAEIYRATASAKLNTSQNGQLTDGLVGLWPLNGPDISGTTAYDRSGNANNGTLTNGPVPTIGKVGQALRFDGTNDYVNIPNTADLNPGDRNFTISAWIKAESAPSDFARIINKGSGAVFYTFVRFPGDKWKFEFRDGTLSTGDLDFGASTMTYGNWMHLVATVDRTNNLTSGYLDGILKDTSSIAGYATVSNTDYLSLGRNSSIGAPFSIDEVRIYDRALTAAEISALYNTGR